jgi:hypothetical protein
MKRTNKWEPNYPMVLILIVILFSVAYMLSTVLVFPATGESACPNGGECWFTKTPTVTQTVTPTQDDNLPTPAPTFVVTPVMIHTYRLPVLFGRGCIEIELVCFAGGYCREECLR